MIEGYYEFDSRKMEVEFPSLSRSIDENDKFKPYFKHINGEFIEVIDGKGDAFSYISGKQIQVINTRLKNKKTGEWINFKIHEHWHKVTFNTIAMNYLPKIKHQHKSLENGQMYTSNIVLSGKIFKFIDENAETFRFFGLLGQWRDYHPKYFRILDILKSIMKSQYYQDGDLEQWEYLKSLDFRKLKVKII